MRCLTRYVIIEFFKVFSVALTAMTLLVLLGVIGQEAIRKGLSPVSVVRMLPYVLPIALLYAIPATMLFGTCSIYGRMSADRELVAIKSLGISPLKMVSPIFVVSFLISLGVVALNDVAVTWGREGLARVALESVEQIAYGMLRTQRSYRCERFSIHVKGVQDRTLLAPTFTYHAAGETAPYVFTAESAELDADLRNQALNITLTNWEVDGAHRLRMIDPDSNTFTIPLVEAAYKASVSGRPQDIALKRIPEETRAQRAELAALERNYAALAAYQMLTGEFESLTSEAWQGRHQRLDEARGRLYRLHTEPWRRWQNGFSCLAFALVGAPLAMWLRSADVWTSFAACFLPILAVYYPLLAYGVDQAKSGALPPYGVWIGNLVLFAAGCWLMKRELRH